MSPPRIELPHPKGDRPRRRWEALGFEANPFPESGISTDVAYNEHQADEIRRINDWLLGAVSGEAKQFAPLLIKGSIGVGKTHVLHRIQRVVEEYGATDCPGKVGVSYGVVTGLGARNLLVGNLLLEALSAPLPGHDHLDEATTELPILQEILTALRAVQPGRLRGIPRTSPLQGPLGKLLQAGAAGPARDEAERLFTSWLRGRDLSRTALEKLGAQRRLEGEGEAVRAYAHLLHLAREVLEFRAWILLIDQLEDLWINEEVTPLRRARFLTDLRLLIDEGLEGAPIAMVLAWNTEVPATGRGSIDVEKRVQAEYRSLYARFPPPIDLPMLPSAEHARSFAVQYIEAGRSRRPEAKPEMIAALKNDVATILARVPESAHGRIGARVVPRAWLRALREWAEEPAPDTVPRRSPRKPR